MKSEVIALINNIVVFGQSFSFVIVAQQRIFKL